MRYIPTNCLRDGMLLAKPLFGVSGEYLMPENVVLDEQKIEKILKWGYPGVYIEDNLSKDLTQHNIITDDLRMQMVSGINKYYIGLSSTNPKAPFANSNQMIQIKEMIDKMIDQILSNKNLVINFIDLKNHDTYTSQHSVNVAVMTIMIGIMLKMEKRDLFKLGIAAFLHDIGKCFVNRELINKPAKLTDEETKKMQEHVTFGYELLLKYGAQQELDESTALAVLQHHERCDGNGYPNGISKRKISVYAKIIALCDVYDALISKRPYRDGMLPSEAMEYVMANMGTQFDPYLTEIFFQKVASYPIGTIVKLSSGESGIVVENFERFTLRPVIRILKHSNNEQIEMPYLIDLKDRDNLNKTITMVIPNLDIGRD